MKKVILMFVFCLLGTLLFTQELKVGLIETVLVKAGSFNMGSNDGERNEQPVHTVTLTNDYYMGKYEVTQEQYYEVMENKPSYTVLASGWENLPAEDVLWYEAVEFCNALSELEGLKPYYSIYGTNVTILDENGNGYRLPTEAEWEYAARGGKGGDHSLEYAGSNTLGEVAWYEDNSDDTIQEVGTKRPNNLGLYDMSGNTWEWCWDWYDDYPSGNRTDPTGASSGLYRIVRGGGYYSTSTCRVASRDVSFPSNPISSGLNNGFRVVRSAGKVSDTSYELTGVDEKEIEKGTEVGLIETVLVKAGSFQMGSNDGGEYGWEKPIHAVTLTTDYYMGKYEVTQKQWYEVMWNKPSYNGPASGWENLPVETTWYDAIEFCNVLSEREGIEPYYSINKTKPDPSNIYSYDDIKWTVTKSNASGAEKGYRLPTEAEWEYAAKEGEKGNHTLEYAGSNSIGEVAWYEDNSDDTMQEVGTKRPNGLGLYDMSGNVYEWCWDWFDYYTSRNRTDPTGATTGDTRVIRGGGFGDSANACSIVARNGSPSFSTYGGVGVRVVRTAKKISNTSDNLMGVGKRELEKKLEIETVLVKAGSFNMGSNDGKDDEKPVNNVTLSIDYYMGTYEVTQKQWVEVMGYNPSYNAPASGWENLPAEMVTWYNVIEFCNALSELEGLEPYYDMDGSTITILDENGKGYRLPTEAEWEYAARGGKDGEHSLEYAGSNTIEEVAWYNENSDETQEVGTKKSNSLGLYDMSGNVWEWCWDWYDDYPSGNRADPTDPTGAIRGSERIFRGGSYSNIDYNSRVADRSWTAPSFTLGAGGGYVGFRVVRSAGKISDTSDNLMGMDEKELELEKELEVGLIDAVLVKAGSFQMGSNDGGDDEQPIHTVTLTTDYYMGTYEVTQEQWYEVMGSKPSSNNPTAGWKNLPVENVSWYDAIEFCNVLSKLEGLEPYYRMYSTNVTIVDKNGKGYKLPTEAEWEYAARGGKNGDHSLEYSGSNTVGQVAWYSGNSDGTQEVGTKQANDLGLHDMSGNVWEWCWDWDGDYTSGNNTDPAGATEGWLRVVRGGSYYGFGSNYCRVASRFMGSLNSRDTNYGFRVVRSTSAE